MLQVLVQALLRLREVEHEYLAATVVILFVVVLYDEQGQGQAGRHGRR